MIEHAGQVEGIAHLGRHEPEKLEPKSPSPQQVCVTAPDLPRAGATQSKPNSLLVKAVYLVEELGHLLDLVDHDEVGAASANDLRKLLRARGQGTKRGRSQQVHPKAVAVQRPQKRRLPRLPRTPEEKGLLPSGREDDSTRVSHTCHLHEIRKLNNRYTCSAWVALALGVSERAVDQELFVSAGHVASWEQAQARWLERHGCDDFHNCTKLLNPGPWP